MNYLVGLSLNIFDVKKYDVRDGSIFKNIDCTRQVNEFIWIYADFVQPTIIDSKRDNFLGIFSLNEKNDKILHKTYSKYYYVTVQNKIVNRLGLSYKFSLDGEKYYPQQ